MKKPLFAVFSLIISSLSVFVSHAQQGKVHYTSTKIVNPIPTTTKEVDYTYKIFKNNDGTFGYKILANGKTYFYQDNYPGKVTGFSDKEITETFAKAIIVKLERKLEVPRIQVKETP